MMRRPPISRTTRRFGALRDCDDMPERRTEVIDDDDLVIAVERLGEAHDRHGAERSDPTGTSAGDDGENRDSSV